MTPATQSRDHLSGAVAEREEDSSLRPTGSDLFATSLAGKRAGMVVFSPYPSDPRPRRAAEALLEEGMSVDLICEGGDGLPHRERRGALDITRLPIVHHRGGALSYAYQYSSFILFSAFLFAWRMLRRRYDLIYVHNMPDILVVSALWPKLFGAKVILDQHDPMPELMMTIFQRSETSFAVRVIRFLEKWSIARVDAVITVNEACRKLIAGRSCPSVKIAVVMNSPDESIFPFRPARSYPVRAADQPFIIMYHGSLVERNGVELAVDALARVRDKIPGVELRIYGGASPYLEKAMNKVNRLGLQDQVRYLGPKGIEQLVQEIEVCDVGVIPNQRNTFTDINTPTRLFEYLALGKPVIAPQTPGILDYFTPESLFFFEAGKVDHLAERLEYVACHPQGAIESAERGQQIYITHTWQQERRVLLRVVTDLISRGTAGREPSHNSACA